MVYKMMLLPEKHKCGEDEAASPMRNSAEFYRGFSDYYINKLNFGISVCEKIYSALVFKWI